MEKKTAVFKWLEGLGAAIITGGANAVILVVGNMALDLFKNQTALWQAVGLATLVSAASYLKQSPLPFYDFEGGKVETPLPDSVKKELSQITEPK